MVKAVLFDFDGTLFFGTNELNVSCFKRILSTMGYPMPDRHRIDETVGMTLDEIVPFLLGSNDPALRKQFSDLLTQCIPEYIAENVKPIPGEREGLMALRKKAKLAICTNGVSYYTPPMLDALGIADCFDALWTYRPGYTKATAIPVLIRELNADYAIFAGDRKMDMEAARSNHLPIAAIRSEYFPEETDGADTIAQSLPELFANISRMLD